MPARGDHEQRRQQVARIAADLVRSLRAGRCHTPAHRRGGRLHYDRRQPLLHRQAGSSDRDLSGSGRPGCHPRRGGPQLGGRPGRHPGGSAAARRRPAPALAAADNGHRARGSSTPSSPPSSATAPPQPERRSRPRSPTTSKSAASRRTPTCRLWRDPCCHSCSAWACKRCSILRSGRWSGCARRSLTRLRRSGRATVLCGAVLACCLLGQPLPTSFGTAIWVGGEVLGLDVDDDVGCLNRLVVSLGGIDITLLPGYNS